MSISSISVEIWLDTAADSSEAEHGYTPLSTGYSLAFFLPPGAQIKAFARKDENERISCASGDIS